MKTLRDDLLPMNSPYKTYPERDPQQETIRQQRRTIAILLDLVESQREQIAELEQGRAA